MKFIIKKDLLLKSLNNVSRVLGGKAILPVLYNFKLSLTSDKLEILASNGETTILDSIDVKDEDDNTLIDVRNTGECLLNYRGLEIIRRLASNEISFDCIDDSILIIDDGNSSFKLNTIPAKEYPSIPLNLSSDSFEMSAKEFAKSINQVAFAASNKDTSNVLVAVNIQIKDGKMILSATDAARLSRKIMHIDSNKTFNVNVPSKIMLDVAKMCENAENIIIGFENRRVYFKLNKLIMFSTLISGDYPNLNGILNAKYTIDLHVSGKEIISAMERVSLLFIDKQTAARLKVSINEFKITSKSSQFGSVVENINSFSFDSQPFEINVDCDFVIQAIRAIGQDEIIFKFTGETKPLFITSDKEPDLVQVITPLRVVG